MVMRFRRSVPPVLGLLGVPQTEPLHVTFLRARVSAWFDAYNSDQDDSRFNVAVGTDVCRRYEVLAAR